MIGRRLHDGAGTGERPLVDLAEVTEIELLILRRMREFTVGEHASVFHGPGFDFVGLREWQAGDRFESIDWPQSTLTNFSPLVVREFEQNSTSSVLVMADRSASTRCGLDGVPIAAMIARAIATVGMSAVFFQDRFGLITFDGAAERLAALRPRVGKGHVLHCLEAYDQGTGLLDLRPGDSLSATVSGFLRRASMIGVVSDFLLQDADAVISELALVSGWHDVFVAIVDAAFAYDLPRVSAGWVQAFDVETGRARVMSRRQLASLGARTREWQDQVAVRAKDAGLDVIRLGVDQTSFDIALLEFVAERRLRRR